MKFSSQRTETHYGEYFEADGVARPPMLPFVQRIDRLPWKEIQRRKNTALLQAGITFFVYGEQQGQIGMLRAEIKYADIREIIQNGLHEFIDTLQLKLNRVGDAVSASFFGSQVNQTSVQRRSKR